ncbi:hypothetical protein [Klebsiella aerogenes]|uniref:hypothetical protein n=1 Tax=Klebsiella aerogenes TaxID=548 RepID=UPI001D193401|nr:hypothetical protein [Klebsiella aerogenes]
MIHIYIEIQTVIHFGGRFLGFTQLQRQAVVLAVRQNIHHERRRILIHKTDGRALVPVPGTALVGFQAERLADGFKQRLGTFGLPFGVIKPPMRRTLFNSPAVR